MGSSQASQLRELTTFSAILPPRPQGTDWNLPDPLSRLRETLKIEKGDYIHL